MEFRITFGDVPTQGDMETIGIECKMRKKHAEIARSVLSIASACVSIAGAIEGERKRSKKRRKRALRQTVDLSQREDGQWE